MATRLASPMSPASQWAAKPDRRHVLTFELGRLRRTRSALLGSRRGTRQMPWRTLLEIKRHSSGGSRANFRANSARRGPAARRARCGRRAADAGRATRSGTSRALRVRGSREMCGSAVREPRQIVVRSVWGWECSEQIDLMASRHLIPTMAARRESIRAICVDLRRRQSELRGAASSSKQKELKPARWSPWSLRLRWPPRGGSAGTDGPARTQPTPSTPRTRRPTSAARTRQKAWHRASQRQLGPRRRASAAGSRAARAMPAPPGRVLAGHRGMPPDSLGRSSSGMQRPLPARPCPQCALQLADHVDASHVPLTHASEACSSNPAAARC